ncbi:MULTISPECIES: spore germination protein [Paenibacillus]
MICIHLSRLNSSGVPYLTPLSPSFYRDWRDMVIRAPLPMLTKRPQFKARTKVRGSTVETK